MHDPTMTRRDALRAGAGLAAAATLAPLAGAGTTAARGAPLRMPGSLPDPTRPAGTPDPAMPFDHVVVVMMENHSFDNYLGMLPRHGQPHADGFTFDAAGRPINSNPYKGGHVVVQRRTSHCQAGVGQSWRSTHAQMDGGRMDGFARNNVNQMVYWDAADLPFYTSLASTFCVGDRWFCSAPCQTYPNRRFMLAGTAFGLVSTDTSSITENPPNGTIVDRLNHYGVSWKDYFTDVPATGVIFDIPFRNPGNLASVEQFALDCAAGTLPAVCWVDSDIGVAGVVADPVFGSIPAPFGPKLAGQVGAQGESEENPGNIALGENFVSRVVSAVLASPLWPRILLLWVYDEHGGYYDHVPPPAAIAPDDIRPRLGPNDPPGGYDVYGPRVPAVVVSGHARRNAVTSVVHDHTSILATIQAKWNLPAMTMRDANATTMMDFLDASRVTFPEPPTLAAPYDVGRAESSCSTDPTAFTVQPDPAPTPAEASLAVRFYGRRHAEHGVVVALSTVNGTLADLRVELHLGRRVAGSAHVAKVGASRRRVVLRGHFADGRYTLVVRRGSRVLVRRRVRLG